MPHLTPTLEGSSPRREYDEYFTPPGATIAVLPHIVHWPNSVWECACGNGAISRELMRVGFGVISTDLRDYGFEGAQQLDFFSAHEKLADVIVTNPPFNAASEFIRHAHELGVQRMALLLKADFFAAKKHEWVFEEWRPCKMLALTWRLDFTGAGAPHTNCMWVLWESHGDVCVPCEYDLLRAPELRVI